LAYWILLIRFFKEIYITQKDLVRTERNLSRQDQCGFDRVAANTVTVATIIVKLIGSTITNQNLRSS
jgi:hypothetical protein